MTERDASKAAFKRALVFSVGLFAVAFALRFLAARMFAGEPVWDGHYYDFGARRIAEGHGYSDDRMAGGQLEWHPWCHYPVGYSAYLALFYRVFGLHGWVPHVANSLSGALVAVVVYLLGREALSDRRARIAGGLTAVHPGLVLYGALVMGEVLAALTVMLAFWIAVLGTRAWGGSSWRRYRGVAAGAVVLGIGALVRPQALLCAPFLAIALPWRARDWLIASVLACGVALLPVFPWTVRNCRVMDGCALVSTNAGWNLAIGSFPRATGRFETLRSSDGCREVTGQVQQDRCWFEYGIANIRKETGRWLGLIPAKLSNTFDHESFAVEYLREARPTDWVESKRVASRVLLSGVHRALVALSPLAFVSLLLRRKNDLREKSVLVQTAALLLVVALGFVGFTAASPTVWPIVLVTCALPFLPLPGRPAFAPALILPVILLATTAFTHAVFFGDDRYHIVVTPALCLLVAAALRSSGDHTRGANTGGARAAGTSSS